MLRSLLIAAALASGACAFDATPGPSGFLCERGGCPPGYTCVDDRCIDRALVSDASTSFDAPVFDARPPADADGDGGIDWCAEAKQAPNTDDCSVSSLEVSALARQAGGVTLYGDTTDYINDLGSPPTYCGLSVMGGADAFYRIDATAGEHIVARVDASWDTALYLSTGCATGDTCPAGAGQDTPNTSGESIDYAVPANATYYLAVDTLGSGVAYHGCYRVTIELVQP